MPTRVTVSGVSKRQEGGDYKEYDYSVTIDDDLTEEEAVNTVLRSAGDYGIYQKSGQAEDRIQVEYVGVQREEPLVRIQPRDASGRFVGYDSVGRSLWALTGKAGTQPRDAMGHFISFAEYAKSRDVNMVTGTAASGTHTGLADLQRGVTEYMGSETWKKAQAGNYWRNQGVSRVKSPYTESLDEEDY